MPRAKNSIKISGDRLRAIRENVLGMTREQLLPLVNVSLTTLQNYEAAGLAPPVNPPFLWTLAGLAEREGRGDVAAELRAPVVDLFALGGLRARIRAAAAPTELAGALLDLQDELLEADECAEDARKARLYVRWRRRAPAAARKRVDAEIARLLEDLGQ